MQFDYEDIIRTVARAQAATMHIPRIVGEEIRKGWKQLPNAGPERSPKSWFFDPLSLQYALGYKDRRFSLTYDTLKRVVSQLSILNGIINVRASQVASFAEPYRKTRSLGFVIKHKDTDHQTTPAEIAFIKELEGFIMSCGRAESNPYSRIKRDNFEVFLRKVVRDTLTYDQTCFEIIPDRRGIPYEFITVDASTIRIASDDRYVGVNSSMHERQGFTPSVPARFAGLYEGKDYGYRTASGQTIDYVQVVNGQIENVYGKRELAFGIRNPRSDIYIHQYGYSEIEQLITIITSHMNAEHYNRNFFTNGAAPKGLLNFKGDNWTQDQLEAFKRMWASMVQGVENAWRTPILQSEGAEWIDLNKTNAEMEFGKWIEYLLKIICGVFLIDPAELNFDLHGGVQQTPLFESSQEWKLKASRDRGLKPLLRFLARMINENIIDQIDDHFVLEFVGLDELSEQEKHELLVEQIGSYMTLNEARRSMDLPDLPYGDMPMNPVYLQAIQVQMEQQQMQQQQEQEAQQAEAPPEEAPPMLPGSAEGTPEEPPQYSENYGLPEFQQ